MGFTTVSRNWPARIFDAFDLSAARVYERKSFCICRSVTGISILRCGRYSISTARLPRSLPEAVDITERRQAEEALRQSQKMEAIGQLTGGVAHDFNNLLTIIRSATDFLRRRELTDDRRRRYIDAISDTVDRASKLTGQLLAFARRQPLTPSGVRCRPAGRSDRAARSPAGRRKIQIRLEICDPECFAMADVAQFETTLINLAVNSRDAMENEGADFDRCRESRCDPRLGHQPKSRAENSLRSRSRTGAAVSPPDQLTAIFEPFYTTKDVGKGTGLGLSQAVGFAKQSGGEIVVKSVLNEGSVFTIYLPQAETPRRQGRHGRCQTSGHGERTRPSHSGRGRQ